MTSQEMAFRVRSSKFRHVFGSSAKKEQCYECMKITKNAHDSNFCAVNPKFLAVVVESAGGGSFIVLKLEQVGRVDINAPKVCGHSGPVLDIKWNPFNDHVIASSSDDATIKVWEIPDEGLSSNLTEAVVELHGHTRRVAYIEWHPTAENILLSAGYDFNCILWNTEMGEAVRVISVHTDTIFSIAWNRDGSLFATTSKDKIIRVINPRDGNVVTEGQGHQGTKASKVVFIGDKNRLFTTGFSRMSDREYAVWDSKNLKKPLRVESIDSSSGVMALYYDYDCNMVYVAGKGDGNVRYFEIVEDYPYVHYLSQYQSGSPQRSLGFMPKRGIDPSKCEIFRFYKLHTAKTLCEPISMIVPRKSEMFQDDLYPATASSRPALSADEWLAGHNRDPILVSLKDGATNTSPTSYKAVKRSASTTSSSTRSSSVGPMSPRSGPMSPRSNPLSPRSNPVSPRVSPAKQSESAGCVLAASSPEQPGSVRNIAKLSADVIENNSNPAHGDGVDVLDRIGMFENKKSASVSTSGTSLHAKKSYSSTNGIEVSSGPTSPLSPQSILSPSSSSTPSTPPSPPPVSSVTAKDYVPIFSKFPREKYQAARSVSDLGFSRGSNRSLHQQYQEKQYQEKQYQEKQYHQQTQQQQSSVSRAHLGDISKTSTPASSPYSTIDTPTSTLEWTSNPLWNSLKKPPQQQQQQQNTSTGESPLSVDTTQLDQVLTEINNDAVDSGSYVTQTTQNLITQSVTNYTVTQSSNYVYRKENSKDAPATTEEDAAAPDWVMDDESAPDNTVIKPSQMRESMRRKKKESSPGNFHRDEKSPSKERRSFRDRKQHSQATSNNVSSSTNASNYQFYIQKQQAQKSNAQKSNVHQTRSSRNRKLTEPTSSDEETTRRRTSEVNNNHKTGPVNEYPTLYDNYPRAPKASSVPPPSSSSSSFSPPPRASSKVNEAVRKRIGRRNTTDATGDMDSRGRQQASSTGASNMPNTDPELRQAYFRQLEQISSLKEQLTVKDKRIRQLETELSLLRGPGEESTC